MLGGAPEIYGVGGGVVAEEDFWSDQGGEEKATGPHAEAADEQCLK